MGLYTIGHSNHDIGTFIGHLRRHGIKTVVDARSTPNSWPHPHFSKTNLCISLREQGIGYCFIDYQINDGGYSAVIHDRLDKRIKRFDNTLGGYPKDVSVYPDPSNTGSKAVKAMTTDEWLLFLAAIMETEWFQIGIGELLSLVRSNWRVALMDTWRIGARVTATT